MSATRVHFTSPVQGGPGWFESYIKFFSRAQSADTGHRIKRFCVVNNVPFQIKIQIFALQFMNVAAQGGLVGITIVKRMFMGSPSCLEIIACETSVCINFTPIFINKNSFP